MSGSTKCLELGDQVYFLTPILPFTASSSPVTAAAGSIQLQPPRCPLLPGLISEWNSQQRASKNALLLTAGLRLFERPNVHFAWINTLHDLHGRRGRQMRTQGPRLAGD